MIIINKIIMREALEEIEHKKFFNDMIKCVVDVEKEIIAVNAELHSDLEQLLLSEGSQQANLYGFNIYYDYDEIEFSSMINIPRNREAGYPRGGMILLDENAKNRIEQVVNKWIEM
jgi:hypothetical protein